MHVEKIKMAFVVYPDLPAPPALSLNLSDEPFHRSADTGCSKNNVVIPNTICTRYNVEQEIVNWAKQNISTEFNSIGINHHGTPTGGVAIPHTDRSRNWVLMWILDCGGGDVSTVFWQEKGFDIEREPGYYPASYNDLQELETHRLESGQWILLNTKVIHSIENLQTTRKSLQIGFWHQPNFMKQHNDSTSILQS